MNNKQSINCTERLREYLNCHVREIYKGFDDCHDERHYDEVFNFTELVCKNLKYSAHKMNMMLTAAAFHDVGRIVSDDHHEEYSSFAVKKDKFIQNYFSQSDINKISNIILSHRSSVIATSEEQMILKDADRASRLKYDRQLYRLIAYNVSNYPNLNNIEIYEKIKDRVENSNKFKDGWLCKNSTNVFGELKPFVLQEFNLVNKSIDNYRLETYSYSK